MESTDLKNFLYDLPEDRIAKHPLAERDGSKLLVHQNNQIIHTEFKKVADFVPEGALVFLNNTKVIAARLYFHKTTGAKIEVFLTDPVMPSADLQQAFKVNNKCTWKCIIGNAKKWKDGQPVFLNIKYESQQVKVSARLVDRGNNLVEFEWLGDITFLNIIECAGHVPLPPYLNRDDEPTDKMRYQTVFSVNEGAVAAPTAGLHFTKAHLKSLGKKGITQDELTLHVSAGTFRPIKEENFKDHPMHTETIIISRRNVEHVLGAKGAIIAVGTTSLRTLESMYWYGAKLVVDPDVAFQIEKYDPYNADLQGITIQQSMIALLTKMEKEEKNRLQGGTGIFIYPGYEFKIVSGLFTNFHMPGSTLILLVAALVGDRWKIIYEEALKKNYRFLSYGDTSLLLSKLSDSLK